MVDKTSSREACTSGTQLTVISWKDERWSADKETLDALNKRLFGMRPRRKYFYETCMGILASIFHPVFRLWLFAVRKGKYYSKKRKRR